VAGMGRVVEPALAGKLICPMHPEIISDTAADCPLCGMPLEPITALGYGAAEAGAAPLIIPATAPLITGTRALVYVEDPADAGVFHGREITLGPRAGEFYLVERGLQEGERVVVNGNFRIDSTLQLRAQRSMMNPAHDDATPPAASLTAPAAFRTQLTQVVTAYLAVQQALSQDDLAAAHAHVKRTQRALAAMNMAALDAAAHDAWMPLHETQQTAWSALLDADEIDEARYHFARASDSVIAALTLFGHAGTSALYIVHCPMALDDAGADWLQDTVQIANPYFGAAMLRCGAVTGALE